ncbi:hypothetical protein B1R94_25910 [Mycolicibacterium litorale]|nr:hypothetical protein B1R94_25910 [Mycolicibacterium litorale]
MGQQYIAVTTMGPTEIEHHTVNWADETDLTDDKIVDTEFDFTSAQLKIQWHTFTDTDTTLCINANGVAPGKYYAGHTVYLAARDGSPEVINRKLRRTVLVHVVQR